MDFSSQISKILLQTNAVSLRLNPPFIWTSGINSPIYTDNRILISYPKERKIIVKKFVELIKTKIKNAIAIAGTSTAGIPWASWIADKTNLPMIYVRNTKKNYGKENQIEGKIETKNYILIEDLISTGKSAIESINAIRNNGGKISTCVSIFSYELKEAKNNFKKINCNFFSLTNFSNLISEAEKINYISKEEKNLILSWKKSPTDWKF